MADTGQNFTVYAGDSDELAFVLRDANGDLLALGGTTATWALSSAYDESTRLLLKTTDDEAEIKYTDAPNGELSVYLIGATESVPGDTSGLGGEPYMHQLVVTDTASSNVIHVSTGTVTIYKTIDMAPSPPPPPPPPP